MTKVEVMYQGENIIKVSAVGHANFAPNGTDIVCAGISTLLQTAVLAIKSMVKVDIVDTMKDGKLILNVPIDTEAQIVIKAILIGLKDIESDYPKNIIIKEIKDVY